MSISASKKTTIERRGSHNLEFKGLKSTESKDMEVLLQAVHNVSASLDPNDVTESIVRESCIVLACDRTSLFMVDDDCLSLVIGKGAKNISLPKTKGIAGHVATTGQALNIVDAHLDHRFDSSFDKKSGYRTKSVLAVPVYDVNEEMVAVIQAINKRNNQPFSRSDMMFLTNFAKHASVALSNSMLHQTALHAQNRLTSLVDTAVELHSNKNTSSIIFTLNHKSHQLVEADRSTLYLLDQSQKELVVMSGDVDIRFPKTVGIAGYVATEGKVVNIPDCYEDDRFNKNVDIKTGYKTKSMLCMPIFGAEDGVIGVLQIINKMDGSAFNEEDEKLLTILLKIAGPVLEHSALRTHMKSQHILDEAKVGDRAPGFGFDAHAMLRDHKKAHAIRAKETRQRALSNISEGTLSEAIIE